MKFIKEAKTLQERMKLYESYRASNKTLTEDVKTVKVKDVKAIGNDAKKIIGKVEI